MLSVLLYVAFNKSHNWHTLIKVVNVDCDTTSIPFLSQVRVFLSLFLLPFHTTCLLCPFTRYMRVLCDSLCTRTEKIPSLWLAEGRPNYREFLICTAVIRNFLSHPYNKREFSNITQISLAVKRLPNNSAYDNLDYRTNLVYLKIVYLSFEFIKIGIKIHLSIIQQVVRFLLHCCNN